MNWRKQYLRPRTGRRSTSLRDLYRDCTFEERRLCQDYYDRYLLGGGTGSLTPFQGIAALVHAVPAPARTLTECDDVARMLFAHLTTALARTVDKSRETAVAVSGGVDSWLLAAILKSLGYKVRGWYLQSGVAGYCEHERVTWLAGKLDVPCEHIQVTGDDFLAALPGFILTTETPIYNLHPVSKLLFAEGLRRRGVACVVTGDGADQVMRHDWDCDLLPLTQACFDVTGVTWIAPFLSDPVLSMGHRRYANKEPVRALAARFGIPRLGKHPTLFPEIAMPSSPRGLLSGRQVGDRSHGVASMALSCLDYTTGLLLEYLETQERCAALPA